VATRPGWRISIPTWPSLKSGRKDPFNSLGGGEGKDVWWGIISWENIFKTVTRPVSGQSSLLSPVNYPTSCFEKNNFSCPFIPNLILRLCRFRQGKKVQCILKTKKNKL
jgi:hypothetical protein